MSVSGLRTFSGGSRPSLELSQAAFLIPSPRAPGNKEGRKSLLPIRQVQTPPGTPSRLAAAHQRPAGCAHAANPSPLPALRQKPEPQLPAPPAPAGEQTILSAVFGMNRPRDAPCSSPRPPSNLSSCRNLWNQPLSYPQPPGQANTVF
ncbi:palmitoyltransferase ZDHHC8-like [Orcinus orca]|uniref:palmitoyltransferase ZDHHC8-like n=1 Tax=Orcinus orca TaxID=9733 RepID=UPI002110F1E3|nr:palmitoyltransferase ZDHHC8-like [Orcinus orca]